MIIFLGSGRLGNQIFQLYFLESIRKPNEKVFAYNMDQVCKYMTGFEKFNNKEIKKFYWLFDNIFIRTLKILAKIHIINSAIEMHNTGYHKTTKGILPVTVSFGYFQNDEYIKNCPNKNLRLKDEYIKKATAYLKPYSDMKKVFLHIRHGDYSEDIRVPDIFLKKALNELQALKNFDKKNTLFILMGDDPKYYENNFLELPNRIISKNDLITDLAIMTQCDGAIISNSTFAWIGAYFCKNTLPVYAPKYWTNWKNNSWYPLKINTKKFKFLDWR